MQFHIPSVVQAVPAAIADPEPVVPVLAGVDADEAWDGAALEATGLAAEGAGAWEAAEAVAKTPPGGDNADAAGADEATGDEATGADVGADEAPVVAPDPEPPVGAAAFPQDEPVGAAAAVEAVDPPRDSTESPGFGKMTSFESTVEQPSFMFATNMSGSALKAV
jgi:hypothetical protein